jgi:hypothetical protein
MNEYAYLPPMFLWTGWPKYTTVPKGLRACGNDELKRRARECCKGARIESEGARAEQRGHDGGDAVHDESLADRVRVAVLLRADQGHLFRYGDADDMQVEGLFQVRTRCSVDSSFAGLSRSRT